MKKTEFLVRVDIRVFNPPKEWIEILTDTVHDCPQWRTSPRPLCKHMRIVRAVITHCPKCDAVIRRGIHYGMGPTPMVFAHLDKLTCFACRSTMQLARTGKWRLVKP